MVALKGKPPKEAKPKKAKVLIFGNAGVGKTWTSLDFPATYYIDCEGGASREHYTDKLKSSGALYFGPEDGAGDFDVVLNEIKTLASQPHDRRTLIIDSLSKLFNNMAADEEERLVAENKKVEFSAEKKPAVRRLRRMIRWLDRIDMNVLLICHEKPLWNKGEQIGETYDCWDKLEYELDLTLQIQRRGPERVALVKKTRLEQFPDASAFSWAYAEFAKRYGRDVMEQDAHALELATPEQVTMVQGLVQRANLSQETIDKWFKRANVDAWEEMDTAIIEKCIDWLRNNVQQPVGAA